MTEINWKLVRHNIRDTAERVYTETVRLSRVFWANYGDWIKNSGATFTFILNPFQWRLVPWGQKEPTEWPKGSNYKGVVFGWLFLIVKVYIDDDTF